MEIMQLKRDLMANNNNYNHHRYYHRDYNNNNDDYYKKRLHYHSRDDNRRNIHDNNKHNYNHHHNNNHNYNNYDIKDNYQLHYNYNEIKSKEYKHQYNGDYLDDLYKKYTKSKEKEEDNDNNTNTNANRYVDNNIEDEDDIVNVTHNMKKILHSNPKHNVNVHHSKPISLVINSQSKEKDINNNNNNNNNHLDLYFDYKKRHTRPIKASINHANSLNHTNNNNHNNNNRNYHNNSYHYQQIPEKDTNRLALEIEHLNQIIHKDHKRGTTQPNKVTTTQERDREHEREQHKAICLYKRKSKDNHGEYQLRNQNFPFKNDSHLNSNNVTENRYNYYKSKHHSNPNNK
jgi:hypothetical protein